MAQIRTGLAASRAFILGVVGDYFSSKRKPNLDYPGWELENESEGIRPFFLHTSQDPL